MFITGLSFIFSSTVSSSFDLLFDPVPLSLTNFSYIIFSSLSLSHSPPYFCFFFSLKETQRNESSTVNVATLWDRGARPFPPINRMCSLWRQKTSQPCKVEFRRWDIWICINMKLMGELSNGLLKYIKHFHASWYIKITCSANCFRLVISLVVYTPQWRGKKLMKMF